MEPLLISSSLYNRVKHYQACGYSAEQISYLVWQPVWIVSDIMAA